MIAFSAANMAEWDKNIVYAPNSFGKTTVSNKIYEYLRQNSSTNVDIFTRKKIEDLVKIFGGTVYIGKKAVFHKELKELESQLENTKIVPSVFKHTGAKSAKKAKEESFYASFVDLENLKAVPEIKDEIKRKYLFLKKFSDEEIKELDNSLDCDLFKKISAFMKEKKLIMPKTKMGLQEISNDFVPENIYCCLNEIYLYSCLNNVTKCYLCGKKYRNHRELLGSIEKRIKSLKSTDENDFATLYNLSLAVCDVIKKTNSVILKQIESENNTIRRQQLLLSNYYNLCLCDASYFQNEITKSTVKVDVNGEALTINDLVKRKAAIENILKCKNDREKEKISKFNEFVIAETKKLLRLRENAEFRALENAAGFGLYIDNKLAKNPCDILSESESKLLSLIVLKAEVKFQHLKTIILDDPIDSYDDYNKRIAANYISNLVKLRTLDHFFIFSNDFECVYFISQTMNNNTIVYLDDIDNIYGTSSSTFKVTCSSKEIKTIGKNDLYFLTSFISQRQTRFPFDVDILFCSLTLTLRNLKTDILKECTNIDVVPTGKAIWAQKIYDVIEGRVEHFDFLNSSRVLIKDVAEPFYDLKHTRSVTNPSVLYLNTNPFENYRENVAKAPLPRNNNYTDVVNYLFKKIVIISYIKYCLEKKLILLVKNNFNNAHFTIVHNSKCGLGSRIETAIKTNNDNGYSIGSDLMRIKKIHEEFSTLYNTIDHGTIMAISPYLSISVRDIKNFKDEVESI